VEDVLKRLGAVEVSVNDTRELVSALAAVVPHLATKADVNALTGHVNGLAAVVPHMATKAEVNALSGDVNALRGDLTSALPHLATTADIGALRGELKSVIPHLATKAEVSALRGELKADIHAMESALIKWIVGTAIASIAVGAGIASVIAKFVH
jgi:hypothetical protein